MNRSVLSTPSYNLLPAHSSPLSVPEQLEDEGSHHEEEVSDSRFRSREINTHFNPDHPINCKMPLQCQDAQGIYDWTIEQRKKASRAVTARSVEELEEMVCLYVFCCLYYA